MGFFNLVTGKNRILDGNLGEIFLLFVLESLMIVSNSHLFLLMKMEYLTHHGGWTKTMQISCFARHIFIPNRISSGNLLVTMSLEGVTRLTVTF